MDSLEIPVTLKFPWAKVEEVQRFLQLPPKEVVITDPAEQTVRMDFDIQQTEYDEDMQMLRVGGYCLMPGVYTGMNGLVAEYSHEVIRQDGLDLTGRPVGAMHVKGNSGYVESVEIEEISAKMYIETMIWDKEDIAKVQNKEYTGFSIDTKVWGYDEGPRFVVMRIGFTEGRVDLCDRPACRECLFLSKDNIAQNKKDNEMVDISKEELERLKGLETELEQTKIKQAADKEVEIVTLIKSVQLKNPTFDAEGYLKAGKDADTKIAMLKTLDEALGKFVDESEPDSIPAPDVGVKATQAAPEIELDFYDVEKFISQQFKEILFLDDSLLLDEDFKKSYKELLEEEARDLINASGN